jgi:hypothetical protein
MRGRGVRLILLATLILPFGLVVRAQALATRYNLPANTAMCTGYANHSCSPVYTQLIQSQPTLMAAGERRVIVGKLVAQSNKIYNILEDVAVGCGGSQEAVTGRNNEGNDFLYSNMPRKGVLVLVVQHLFQAPTTGFYTCRLWGLGSTGVDPSNNNYGDPTDPSPPSLTALTQITQTDAPHTVQSTYLDVGNENNPNAQQWVQPAKGTNTTCLSQDLTANTCVYVQPGSSAYVLYNSSFVADATATKVSVYAGLAVTTCPSGTKSCYYHGPSGVDISELTARLEVVQLDSLSPPGYACGTWSRTAYQTPRISNDAHHFKMHFNITHTISGCTRRLLVRVYVSVASGGNPVKIEGVQSTGGPALSNAYALNIL